MEHKATEETAGYMMESKAILQKNWKDSWAKSKERSLAPPHTGGVPSLLQRTGIRTEAKGLPESFSNTW